MKTLVYGFGPYGKYRENVTMDIIREINRRKIALGFVFEVQFQKSQFVDLLKRHQPDRVIGLGQHPRARKIRIERRARNWQASPSSVGKPIETDETEYRFVSLKIPATDEATVTYDAGDYVCNYSMYVMCRETEKRDATYAFLHVPINVDIEKATRWIGEIVGCV